MHFKAEEDEEEMIEAYLQKDRKELKYVKSVSIDVFLKFIMRLNTCCAQTYILKMLLFIIYA